MKQKELTAKQIFILCEAAQILKIKVDDLLQMNEWISSNEFIRKREPDKGIFFVRSRNAIERFNKQQACSPVQIYDSLKKATYVAKTQATNIENIKNENPFYVFKAIRLVSPRSYKIEADVEEL